MVIYIYLIRRLFDPEIFQGKYKKRNYFEGWYYKLIDEQTENVFAVIPGVSIGKNVKDSHAFIQILNAQANRAYYIKYDISKFSYSEKTFEVNIGDNYFSDTQMRLSINKDGLTAKGFLSFNEVLPFPKSVLRPGIMGPYTFIPFMECYHGIVNIHHKINGNLFIDGSTIDFTNGYGYIEKDWGRSFPKSWIWLQSNHFGKNDVSLMFSLAEVPWFSRHFPGFISFIRIKDTFHIFSTYTKAKITELKYEGNRIMIQITDSKHRLEIEVFQTDGGVLKAPENGLMEREIIESITSVVKVKLFDKNSNLLYEGTGKKTGVEICGNIIEDFYHKRPV